MASESLREHRSPGRLSQSQLLRPTTDSRQRARPEIVLITGESGIGKTTYCIRLLQHARKRGLTTAGLLTLPRCRKGQKIGLDIEDVRTGARRPLAERLSFTGGPATEKWQFHVEGLNWGGEILRRATPCDFLLIDELGPLELERNMGWTLAFDVLGAGDYHLAAVVVRPSLVPNLQSRLDGPRRRTLLLNESNRRDLDPQLKFRLKVVP